MTLYTEYPTPIIKVHYDATMMNTFQSIVKNLLSISLHAVLEFAGHVITFMLIAERPPPNKLYKSFT